MKPIFYILIILTITIVFFSCFKRPNRSSKTENGSCKLSEIQFLIEKLYNSESSYAFLIIEATDSEDFLQAQIYEGEIGFSFPLITERQKSLEQKIRTSTESLGLKLEETTGSNGTKFLDYSTIGSVPEYLDIILKLSENIYEIEPEDLIKYSYDPGK